MSAIEYDSTVFLFDRAPFSLNSFLLRDEFLARGLRCVIADWANVRFLLGGAALSADRTPVRPLRRGDVILMTSPVTSRDPIRQYAFLFNEVESLRRFGLKVLNGDYRNRDKWLQAQAFESNGIRHPRTTVVSNPSQVGREYLLGGGIILKPRIGRGGHGQVIIEEDQVTVRGLGEIGGRTGSAIWESFRNYDSLVCQELIRPATRELRVVVVGGEAVLVAEHSAAGDHPAMRSAVNSEASALAIQAVSAVGWDYGEVDIVSRDGSLFVIEVNPTLNGDVYQRHSDFIDPLAGFKRLGLLVEKLAQEL